MDEDALIGRILRRAKTIAVVGLSDKPERTSHEVAQFLQSKGYRIVPVNPTVRGDILGEAVYPDLLCLPARPDVVNIFRRSEQVPPVMDQAIQIGAPVVWMQLEIANEAAAAKGRAAGIAVIQNRYIMIEWNTRWGDKAEL